MSGSDAATRGSTMTTIRRSLDRAASVLKEAGRGFVDDRIPREAAALTYYSALSLAPILFLAAAVAGFLLGSPEALQTSVDQVTDVAGQEVGDALESVLEAARSQRAGTLSIGIVLALFAASSIFSQVQAVLGKVFRIPLQERRTGAIGWLVRRAIGAGTAMTLALLVLTPIAAVAVAEFLVDLVPDQLAPLRYVLALGIPVSSIVVLMAAVGISYKVLTSVRVPVHAAAAGGVTTALLGLTAAWGVGVYLSRVADEGALGALGGVAILLVFFDVLWMVYLFGAGVARVVAARAHASAAAAPPVPEPLPEAEGREQDRPGEGRSGGIGAFVSGAVLGWLYRGRRR